MNTTNRGNDRVLELAGDGSRTESLRQAEEQAAQKLHAALPAPRPDGIRPMEAAWILACLYLFIAYLEGQDRQLFEQQLYPASVVKNCERNTRVAVAALNGWIIETPEVKVACKRVKS